MFVFVFEYFYITTIFLGTWGVFIAGSTSGISLLKGEEIIRTNNSIPGCWLGGEFYLLGQRWSPVIEPYGLMVCVKCQCASIFQKNKLQQEGKVMCRNIKYECPEPRCPGPVLRPNTCCKVCPNQGPHFEDNYKLVQEDMAPPVNDGVGSGTYTELSALLVGRPSSRHGSIRTRAVGLMNVALVSRGSFSYALRFTRLRHPERIILMDKYGTVFHQQYIPQQTEKHGKICGIWRDIPPVYMQYILQGRIHVTITTKNHKNGEISGRLVEDSIVEQAIFQGLLAPTRKTGAGGKFDIMYDAKSRVASFSIRVENLRQSGRGVNDYFVTMEKDREVAYQRVIRASRDEQLLTGKLRLDNELSRRMARGRLYIRVTSRSGETLRGIVQPRLSCNAFIASLSSSKDATEASYAVAQIQEDSSLRYKISVASEHTNLQELDLIRLNINRSLWKPLAILTHTYRRTQTHGGQAVGNYHKMRTIDTLSLLEQEVYAKIRLYNSPGDIRGRLVRIPYVDHIDIFTDKPLVLSSTTCDVIVFIWLVIDLRCHVRYHIITSGLETQTQTMIVKLTSFVYWNRHSTQNVTEYTFDEMSGIIKVVPDNVFTSLQFGENYVDVRIPDTEGCGKLKASQFTDCAVEKLVVVETPMEKQATGSFETMLFRQNSCWSQPVSNGDGIDGNSIETGDRGTFRCYHDGQFYSHGESWLPVDHECFTCRCQRGHVICDRVLCPPSNCSKEMTSNDQCCPVCEDENSTEKKLTGSCYFSGDKRWHSYGTTWHPYISQLGYSKCAVCSCIPGSPDVNCSRLPCPELDCPQSLRIRRNPDDCCQECKVSTKIRPLQEDKKKDCEFGDKSYSHGESWHPSLTPFGEMKCYLCRCKSLNENCTKESLLPRAALKRKNFPSNGETRCRKIQCKALQCVNKYRPSGQCCPVCLSDLQSRRRSYHADRRHGRESVKGR